MIGRIRPEQTLQPIIIVTSVPYSWWPTWSHSLPDSPDLTGNRKGSVTGYDELVENGAMNGNIWYTGCVL